jgi:hypothetical protein
MILECIIGHILNPKGTHEHIFYLKDMLPILKDQYLALLRRRRAGPMPNIAESDVVVRRRRFVPLFRRLTLDKAESDVLLLRFVVVLRRRRTFDKAEIRTILDPRFLPASLRFLRGAPAVLFLRDLPSPRA